MTYVERITHWEYQTKSSEWMLNYLKWRNRGLDGWGIGPRGTERNYRDVGRQPNQFTKVKKLLKVEVGIVFCKMEMKGMNKHHQTFSKFQLIQISIQWTRRKGIDCLIPIQIFKLKLVHQCYMICYQHVITAMNCLIYSFCHWRR